MKAWAELWHQFVAILAQQPAIVAVTVWLGVALVLVMAAEGLLLNLFPSLVLSRYSEKLPKEPKTVAPAPPLGLRDIPAKAPEPVAEAALSPSPSSPPLSPPPPNPPSAPAAKLRPPRNRKKPAPGPKSVRATTGWRRAASSRERLSRGTSRLLTPKN